MIRCCFPECTQGSFMAVLHSLNPMIMLGKCQHTVILGMFLSDCCPWHVRAVKLNNSTGVKERKQSENRGIQEQFNLLSKILNVVFKSHLKLYLCLTSHCVLWTLHIFIQTWQQLTKLQFKIIFKVTKDSVYYSVNTEYLLDVTVSQS